MNLAGRIGSLNGDMHRQQIEVLQQYCRELEERNRYYQHRLQDESTRNTEMKNTLVEDWYYVKKELYNFITFTGAMTASQARESPLLKNIARFDQKVIDFTTGTELEESDGEVRDVSLVQKRSARSNFRRLRPNDERSGTPRSPGDVEKDTLQDILNLW